jgi:hypothetical protein
LLTAVIRRLLKYEPEARELLDQLEPPKSDPDDGLGALAETTVWRPRARRPAGTPLSPSPRTAWTGHPRVRLLPP